MIIVLDLGNTNIDVGVYLESKKLQARFKIHSDLEKSESEYLTLIDSFLTYHRIDKTQIKGGIISSVVPNLTLKIKKAVDELLNINIHILNKNLKSGLSLKIDNPSELGGDLLAESVGANFLTNDNTIIIDLGTVNKILVVTKNKEYLGGIFFPGTTLEKNSLSHNTALLYDADLRYYKSIIGKSTSQAIANGILYSTIFTIDGFIKEIEKETKTKYKIILTGGDGFLFKDIFNNAIYEPNLVFIGLLEIYFKNVKE